MINKNKIHWRTKAHLITFREIFFDFFGIPFNATLSVSTLHFVPTKNALRVLSNLLCLAAVFLFNSGVFHFFLVYSIYFCLFYLLSVYCIFLLRILFTFCMYYFLCTVSSIKIRLPFFLKKCRLSVRDRTTWCNQTFRVWDNILETDKGLISGTTR